LEKLKT